MERTKKTYIWEFIKSSRAVLAYKFFKIKPRMDKIGTHKQLTMQKGTNIIEEAIKEGKPFAAIRFGAVEISALNNYEKKKLGFVKKYKKSVLYSIKNNAGYFPATDEYLDHYGRHLETNLQDTDILGISGVHMENYFFNTLMPSAKPVQNWVLDPLLGKWSHLLAGKKVLVISPFAKQIEQQYTKRHLLFGPEPSVLPEFELETIEAVLTSGEALDDRFSTWFEALDYMKVEILKKDYDIALIGAGAYGSLLALFVKSQGKMAIQTGGATQLLFGIIGKRWENREYVSRFVNPHWQRPELKPLGYENIEKGCYW